MLEPFDPLVLLIDSDGVLFRPMERRPPGFCNALVSDAIRSRVWLLFGLAALASFCRNVGAIQVLAHRRDAGVTD